MTTDRYNDRDSWQPVGGCEDDEDCLDGSGDWGAASSSTRPSKSTFRISIHLYLEYLHTFSSLHLFHLSLHITQKTRMSYYTFET